MRRVLLGRLAALGALAGGCSVGWASEMTATVEQGTLRGTEDNGAHAFLGVPFAAAPIGDLRWAPPEAPQAWGDEVRDATKFGANCPQEIQPEGFMMWTSEFITPIELGVNEDCLFANIWTPAKAEKDDGLPVLFYIHGGAYTSGSGAVPLYNGANLAKQGVVVVTINYRLRALGFMAHPELTVEQGASGNYGIQDQIQALHWVRDNIAAFGGDPAKVTIAGQSAGGGSVMAILASPMAEGLFRAAIVQSAPGVTQFPPLGPAEAQGAALVESWGAKSIAEARKLDAETIMLTSGEGKGGFPIADGKVVPAGQSFRMASNVPVMIGYTLNDLFAPTRKVTAAEWLQEAQDRYGSQSGEFLRYYPGISDNEATASATREANDRMQMAPILQWSETRGADAPVYAYLFSHVEPGPDSARYGAFHSSELAYMFDTLHLSPNREFTDVDRHVVDQFSGAVLNFVKTGSPNGEQLPQWQPLDRAGKFVMEFGDDAQASRIYPQGADEVMAAGKPIIP